MEGAAQDLGGSTRYKMAHVSLAPTIFPLTSFCMRFTRANTTADSNVNANNHPNASTKVNVTLFDKFKLATDDAKHTAAA